MGDDSKYRDEVRDGSESTNNGEERANGPGEGRISQRGDSFLDSRTFYLVAGGAMGALAALSLSSVFPRIRPFVVNAVREGYGMAEWLAGKVESAKEDVEDVVAEAVMGHESQRAAGAEIARREQELLQAFERMMDEKLEKMRVENRNKEEDVT